MQSAADPYAIVSIVLLSKGANVALTAGLFTVRCGWGVPAGVPADADASALLLAGGKVRSDADFVFYNQPSSADGSVRHLGKTSSGSGPIDSLNIDLGVVPSDVDAVVVVVSFDGPAGSTLALLQPFTATCSSDDGTEFHQFVVADLRDETAAVLVEFYRRAGAWKLRAVGQGYFDGLGGLARDFGVVVDDEPNQDSQSPASGAAQATAPGVAPALANPPTPMAPSIDWRNPPVPVGY